MEGGRNGMEQYNDTATIEKVCWQLRVLRAPEKQYDKGNAATIEKHAFDIAKKGLGADEGNTATFLEVGGRKAVVVEPHYHVLGYAKKRREQYDKPPEDPPLGDNIVSSYNAADHMPHPLDPFR